MHNNKDNTFYDIQAFVYERRSKTDDEIIQDISEYFEMSVEESTRWYDTIYSTI